MQSTQEIQVWVTAKHGPALVTIKQIEDKNLSWTDCVKLIFNRPEHPKVIEEKDGALFNAGMRLYPSRAAALEGIPDA